jgi:hypothetical protein
LLAEQDLSKLGFGQVVGCSALVDDHGQIVISRSEDYWGGQSHQDEGGDKSIHVRQTQRARAISVTFRVHRNAQRILESLNASLLVSPAEQLFPWQLLRGGQGCCSMYRQKSSVSAGCWDVFLELHPLNPATLWFGPART